MATALKNKGLQVPVARQGFALVDTGASVSCIDSQVAIDLGLPVVGTVKMASASHDNHTTNVYPIQITLQGAPVSFGAPRAMGASLAAQDYIAIIGRDVLSVCTMFYNGHAGQITLSL
jgi:predicted aspartyl protease